jgi:GT2 family glycosyltransferase
MINASIILPTYNQRERLEFTLATLRCQKYDDGEYEIVVVNDGSTDSTLQFLSSVEMQNLTIVNLHHNKGRAYARNQGIKVAKNDVLIFSDSDRIVPNNFISSHVEGLHEHSVNVGCIAELFERDTYQLFSNYNDNKPDFLKAISKARLFNYYEFITKIYNQEGLTCHELSWCSLFSGNFCIYKSDIEKLGLFDEAFTQWGFENFELGYRLFKHGYLFYLNQKAINFHLYHERDRIGEERENSHKIFMRKYADEGLKHLLQFLDGDISLEKFQGHMTGIEADQESSYFRSRKFGSKVYDLGDPNTLASLWN